jgi:endoglucanase
MAKSARFQTKLALVALAVTLCGVISFAGAQGASARGPRVTADRAVRHLRHRGRKCVRIKATKRTHGARSDHTFCSANQRHTTGLRASSSMTKPKPKPQPKRMPFLHQRGTHIVDSSGNVVQLRGVDLGGWLEWEGWIWGGGFDSETTIMNGLTSLVGAQAADQFQTDVFNDFITDADIKEIAQLGFNVIRVPFNYKILQDPSTPYVYKASGWRILDNIINWAARHHVYVVLDMHAAPGGQALGFPYDDTWPMLWGDPDDQSQMVAMWQAIATRYASNPAVAGYDLLGEPWPTPNDQALVSLYARTIAAIRQVDTAHMIFLEGAMDSRDFSWTTQPLDSNMVYSPHMYLWSQQNAQRQLDQYAQMAKAQNVPLWIGEFGENTLSADASQVAMFKAEPTVAGWAYWTWKKAPDWADALETIPTSPAWQRLITWIAYPTAPQPTAAQATQAMQDFISEMQYTNNMLNPQMAMTLTGSS